MDHWFEMDRMYLATDPMLRATPPSGTWPGSPRACGCDCS